MPSSRPDSRPRRRPCWGSPVLAVVVVAVVAALVEAPTPPTPLTPSTLASSGSAATESQPLDANIGRQVAEGIDVAAQRIDVAPFDVVGVSWAPGTRAPARVRVRKAGTWSDWYELETEGDDAPDPGSPEGTVARVVSAPVWVDGADGYEVDVPEGVGDVAVHLVRDRPAAAPGQVTLAASPGTASKAPAITSRRSWSARTPTSAPTVAPTLKMAFVHHTVSTNDYTAADVPGMLRGIQAYHMDVNGWDDMGYNFLVDRFGGIWEGRAGGTTRNVVGAHAVGFNNSSVGVAVLGEFTTATPTSASIGAVGRLLGWRLKLAGVDPEGRASMPVDGGTRSFAAVSGHRDADATACPGTELYARLSTIRALAAGESGPAPNPPIDTAVACPAGRVPEGGFVDVGSSNVHHRAVDCLAWYGVTAGGPAGMPPDRYGPELRVRRGQMATFIVRTLERVDPALVGVAEGEFACPSDPALALAVDHPHADAVRRLARAGVVSGGVGGAPADCFGPEVEVRRDQMASFLHAALELATGQRISSDTDAFDDDKGSPHEPAIDALSGRRVVAGTGFRTYAPSSPVRRDQMASFLARQLGALVDAGLASPPP